MSLKQVEVESFLKSFLLFFSSLTLLMSVIMYSNYTAKVQSLDEKLFTQMRLCSFDLQCEQFIFDFVSEDQNKLYQFYKNETGAFALFSIPNTTEYVMKLLYPIESYQKEIKKIQNKYIYKYLWILLALALISGIFSWFALRPLRQALLLSDEFIKDILHDFNTPISTLRLNSSLLHGELPENKKITRIEQAVKTILNLQNNLRSYIDESPLRNDTIDLKELIERRSEFFAAAYPKLHFIQHLEPMKIHANIDAITRILDNLISNAAKYNTRNGSIEITLSASDKRLMIKDTGKGIKNPKKIFQRFYKEHDRGLGIGLHIVKKLCDTMHIPIHVDSELNIGSTFTLELKHL